MGILIAIPILICCLIINRLIKSDNMSHLRQFKYSVEKADSKIELNRLKTYLITFGAKDGWHKISKETLYKDIEYLINLKLETLTKQEFDDKYQAKFKDFERDYKAKFKLDAHEMFLKFIEDMTDYRFASDLIAKEFSSRTKDWIENNIK